MLLRPMIGGWEVPRIADIRASEARRLVRLPVPGLSGDLHQDLGRSALIVELTGSLYGDEARDDFLSTLKEQYHAGEPVDFVADIVNEAELEQVLIEALELNESAATPNTFHYRIRLREYTEPPEPPGPDLGLPALDDLGLDIDLGLDLLDLPGLLVPVPDIGDLLAPLAPAAEELGNTVAGAAEALAPLASLLESGGD